MCTNRIRELSGISRRDCHRQLTAAVAGLALRGLVAPSLAESAEVETTPSAGKYIDMRVHLGQRWGRWAALPPDSVLRWMDDSPKRPPDLETLMTLRR